MCCAWHWLFLAEMLWGRGCIEFISFARGPGIAALGSLGEKLCTVKAEHVVILGPASSDCLGFQTLFSSSEDGWMLGVLLWPGAFCSEREIGNQGLYCYILGTG